ncbi:HlyD family secretion protein [Litchfieldia salsa]|uniref:Barrel-sandwich domain of CusB or HlyD membrane-fusion n=1 Tax=Litchfieldia salsa TaxID=930152 RepID=A0A1H0W5X4_9BACI|nr:HlyD family efflux transporter periplasmic adaptor subunit [Litchfieldia salsa]SDP85988.1 Barrel-sandwich domain of CusB or HlyD membrane-fusion [Litchfieldia salsa]
MKKKIALNVLIATTVMSLIACSGTEEELGYSGFVEGKKIKIQSEYVGKVDEIHVKEGDSITNEDVLITLNTQKLDIEIENAKVGIDIANAKKQEAEDLNKDYLTDQADGSIKQAQNQLKLLELQKQNSLVKGPVQGFIQDIYITKGEIANPNQDLLSIVDPSMKEVIIYVSEKDVSSIELEDKVKIRTDAFENDTFEGTIKRISSEAEFTPQTIQTKEERAKRVFAVSINVSDVSELKPGMSVEVDL